MFSGDRMTGKCLLACLFLFVTTILPAELAAGQNAATRLPDRQVEYTPATGLPSIPVTSSTATTDSTTEIDFAGTGLRMRALPSLAHLRSLVHSAAIIFCGRVISVHREAIDATAATMVTFHVEDAFRGVVPGESLTIHEWAGLWTRGETYHVGERVLLFLYPSSRLGFTSPVHGIVGRFEMSTRETIAFNAVQTEFFSGQIKGRRGVRISYAEFALCIRRAMAAPGETIRSNAR
jgi:hypothetical protein